jgi:hypothetical protein
MLSCDHAAGVSTHAPAAGAAATGTSPSRVGLSVWPCRLKRLCPGEMIGCAQAGAVVGAGRVTTPDGNEGAAPLAHTHGAQAGG